MNHAGYLPLSVRLRHAPLVVFLIVSLLPSSTGAAGQFTGPITSNVTVPFSGTLKRDAEDITVSGVLQIRTDVTLTRTSIFAEVESGLSQTTGVGVTSGQRFVGIAGPSQMCRIPAGVRGPNPVSMDVVLQYRMVATGPLSPFYTRGPERLLHVLVTVSFLNNGSLAAASAVVPDNLPSSIAAEGPN